MLTKEKMEVVRNYQKGIALYQQRNFSKALQCFEKALALDPQDGPSQVYLERCRTYVQTPPPADWDGVFVMTTK